MLHSRHKRAAPAPAPAVSLLLCLQQRERAVFATVVMKAEMFFFLPWFNISLVTLVVLFNQKSQHMSIQPSIILPALVVQSLLEQVGAYSHVGAI